MAGQVCEYVGFVTGEERCRPSKDGEACYTPTKVEKICVSVGEKTDREWFRNASEKLNAEILKYAADNKYKIYARGGRPELSPPLMALMGGYGTAVAGTMTGLGGIAIGTGTVVGGAIATASGAIVIAGLGFGMYGIGLAAYEQIAN